MHELTLDEEEDNTVEKGSRGLDRSSTDSRVASKYSGITLSLSLSLCLSVYVFLLHLLAVHLFPCLTLLRTCTERSVSGWLARCEAPAECNGSLKRGPRTWLSPEDR